MAELKTLELFVKSYQPLRRQLHLNDTTSANGENQPQQLQSVLMILYIFSSFPNLVRTCVQQRLILFVFKPSSRFSLVKLAKIQEICRIVCVP